MFNPNEHMMKLKGKDYLQVAWRLVWFREDHPDWCIDTSVLVEDAEHAIFKAVICDESGAQKSSGHGSESKRDFGDYLEKAETKAVGRALAMLGYGTQFAADELDEGERIVDSPIARVKMPDIPKAEGPVQIESGNSLPFDAGREIRAFLVENNISVTEFKPMYKALVEGGVIKEIKQADMTTADVENLKKAMRQNFSGVCK